MKSLTTMVLESGRTVEGWLAEVTKAEVVCDADGYAVVLDSDSPTARFDAEQKAKAIREQGIDVWVM
jgi:hypothetical protein